MQPVSAFLFYYMAIDGAASVNVSFQVRAKNHLIWFCKLFTNIRGLLFPVQLILGVKSTVFFTPKLFVWNFVYTVQVLSRGYNQCGKHLPACKCLHWEYLHHCWNIVNIFRVRMCSWYLPKGMYGEILSLGTVLIRTPLGAGMWLDIMITVDHFIQYHSCCQWIQTNTSLQWDEYWQC